jgi:hypothetical protein
MIIFSAYVGLGRPLASKTCMAASNLRSCLGWLIWGSDLFGIAFILFDQVFGRKWRFVLIEAGNPDWLDLWDVWFPADGRLK